MIQYPKKLLSNNKPILNVADSKMNELLDLNPQFAIDRILVSILMSYRFLTFIWEKAVHKLMK